jgi:hypothetical protein
MLSALSMSLTLASVGAAFACASALSLARDRVRLSLSLAPLALGAAVAMEPSALDLYAWSQGAESLGEPLSVTLRYEGAAGLSALSAPLAVAAPLSGAVAWLLAALGLAGVSAELAGASRASRVALGLWGLTALAWLLAAPLSPLSLTAGEAGVRDWIALGAELTGVEAQRVSAFVPPAGEWRWAPAHLWGGLVSIAAALLGSLMPESASARRPDTYEGRARLGVTVGAALALLGVGAQLAVSGGLTASAAPLLGAALALGVASALAHRGAQALALSLGALLSLAIL